MTLHVLERESADDVFRRSHDGEYVGVIGVPAFGNLCFEQVHIADGAGAVDVDSEGAL